MGNLSVSLHGQLTTTTGTFCKNHWTKTVSQYCFLSKAPIAVSTSQDFYNKSAIASSNLTQRNAVSSCGWNLNWGKTQHSTAENTVQGKTSFQDQGKEQELFALSLPLSHCAVYPTGGARLLFLCLLQGCDSFLMCCRLWFLSLFAWSEFWCVSRLQFSFFLQDQSSDIYLHVIFLSVDLCFAFAAEVLQLYGSGFCCICRQMRRLNIQ